MTVGQGFPVGGGAPYQTNGSDMAVNAKQYPGFILNPISSEVGGVYIAMREINGAFWLMQNADVSAGGSFFQVNVALPSFAVVTQNGTQTIYTAVAGLFPFVWTASSVSLLGNARPGGRLTLASGTPVLSADVSNAGIVYYTPYTGNLVPVYVGPTWQNVVFVEIALTLNATFQTSGNLYDIFLFNNAGVVTIVAGPAWASGTSRGVGAGTTQIQLLNGIWVNTVSITAHNGTNTFTVPAQQGTYLGTIYCNANAAVTMNFKPAAAAGGSNNILGLYNAYNRVLTVSTERDSNANHTYALNVTRAFDGSNNSRITFIDGLQQSDVDASSLCVLGMATNGSSPQFGFGLDSTTTLGVTAFAVVTTVTSTGEVDIPNTVVESFPPQIGLHFIQSLERAGGSVSAIFYTNNAAFINYSLVVKLEM